MQHTKILFILGRAFGRVRFTWKNIFCFVSLYQQARNDMEGPCTSKQIYRNLKRRDTYPF